MMKGQMEEDQASMVPSSLKRTMAPWGSMAAQEPCG
jgi:hypothetical protein